MALRVYGEAVEVIRRLRGVVVEVNRHDGDLSRQMRRALTSIPLNIAEGEHRRNGNARQRFETAMGSANEVRACLETAQAWGYTEGHEAERDMLERIARTLSKLAH